MEKSNKKRLVGGKMFCNSPLFGIDNILEKYYKTQILPSHVRIRIVAVDTRVRIEESLVGFLRVRAEESRP